MSVAQPARVQPRHARRWLPPVLIGGLAVLGLGAWVVMRPREEPSLAVRRDLIVQYMRLNGSVVAPPTAQAVIYPPYMTTVKKVRTTLNERVRRGTVLLELTIPSADAALHAARQAVREAGVAYADAQRGASDSVRSAERQLAAARTAEGRARAAAQPPAGEPGTGATASPATADLEQAISERRAAEQALAQARAEAQAASEPARMQLEDARAALREAQSGRAQGLIRAPIEGTMLALNAREGELVGKDARKPLATIVNLDRLQVVAPLSAKQLPHATVATPVKLMLENLPNTIIDGRIAQVTSVADAEGRVTSYTAIIAFDNSQGLVRPDQQAKVSVKLGAARNVVAVPAEAVDDRQGQPVVQVWRSGRWVAAPVQVGWSDGMYTEIREGIREGEEVKVTHSILGSR
jgi:RND family efflux transporter MFP subunit